MRNNVILIGLPGVGKSTSGVILAKVLNYDFLDSDLVIQKKMGKRLKDIISELKQYRTISFSIKGPCVCPNCRNVKKSIPCAISDLVFQKAQNVLV